MNDFLQRLKQRKLVQWAVAYLAAAWVLLQVIDLASGSYGWPKAVMHIAFGVLALGFVVVLVLAWYHGERGVQRINGVELLIIALVLAVGGGVLWNFARTPTKAGSANLTASARSPDAAQRNPGTGRPTRPHSAATAAASGLRSTRVTSPIAAQPIPAKSVAVLPFESLSSDKNNAYFADGMQDLILTMLADIGDLKVISRTSTAKYASHPDDLKTIGQQLGVATILEGSVQKAGNQVLINVQLIDVKTDSHIWAESYTRTLDNIFGVEGEVAEKVAKALNAKLTANESQAVASIPTHNPQAYNAYLRATHFANEAGEGGQFTYLPKAIAAYQQAVKEDPNFALAWAGLSNARSNARYYGVDSSRNSLLKAAAAATRALTLAPNLPEAHLAMGGVQRFLYHDLDAAYAQYQQAVGLRPNSAGALADLAINEGNRGHTSASLKTLQRLVTLEPTQSAPFELLGLFQTLAGNYAAARPALARAIAINPDGTDAYAWLSRIDVLSNGDVDAATKVLAHIPASAPRSLRVSSQRMRLLIYRRDFASARRLAATFATQFDSGAGPATIAGYQAGIEWLADNKEAARGFYRKVIALLAKPQYDVNFEDYASLGVAYARLGNAAKAKQEMDAFVTGARHAHYAGGGRDDVQIAKVQLALGENSQAIDTLRMALAQPVHGLLTMPVLKLDPTWDPIRHDPRFQALLKKYGNTTPASASSR